MGYSSENSGEESISDHIHSKVHVILPVPDLEEPGYPHVEVTMLMQKGVNGYPGLFQSRPLKGQWADCCC